MKLLFTGANGFLGKNIIPLLEAKGFEVEKLDLRFAKYTFNIASDVPIFDEAFDIVFHAAGKAHMIPKTKEEIATFYNVNFEGTKNLCKSLEKNLPKHFIFVSTVAVYGKNFGQNISESTPLLGNTPYADSKKKAENFLIGWCSSNKVKLTILRPSLIAGSNPPGNLGDMINAIKKGLYFNIGGGKAKKSVVWVEDFADIIKLSINKLGGVYNVCDTSQPSFGEIASKISKKLGKKEPLNIPFFIAKLMALIGDLLGNKAPINSLKLKKITEDLTFSNEKIRKELNWQPTNVLEKL